MVIISIWGNSYDLTEEQLVDEISRALDSTLGEGSTKLVFKTINVAYGIDYEVSLSSKLESFEQSLKKLLGESASNTVIESVVSNLQKYRVPPSNDNR